MEKPMMRDGRLYDYRFVLFFHLSNRIETFFVGVCLRLLCADDSIVEWMCGNVMIAPIRHLIVSPFPTASFR